MSRHVSRRWLFGFVCLSILLTGIFFGDSPCEAAKNPGRIQGVVRDSDGDPVIGAEVTLTHGRATGVDPDVTRTNSKGKYKFKNLELGTYEVSLSEDCYVNGALQSQQIELTLEAPLATANFNLTELTNLGTLAGIVRDWITKKPLKRATVRYAGPPSEASETTTNRKGIFRFDDQCFLANGTEFPIEARKSGYQTQQKSITAGEGENNLLFKLTPASITTSSTTTTTRTTTTTTTKTTTTTSSTTTTTQPRNITGDWQGNVNLPDSGPTFMRACVAQSGSQINGTWEVPATGRCGTLSGSISGTTVTLSMQHGNCACPTNFSGSATLSNSDTRISGSFSGTDCNGRWSMTFTLNKVSAQCP